MITYDISKELSTDKTELVVHDKDYDSVFCLKGNDVDVLYSLTVKSLKIKFINCSFNRNIYILFDQSVIEKIEISFSNCFILGNIGPFKNKIKSPNACNISLFFSNCIIEDISFDDVELRYLRVNNSIIRKNYFSIRNSDISNISFYNVVGNFGIYRSRSVNVYIGYGDDNFYLPSKKITQEFLSLGRPFGSIFAFPTKILISQPYELFVEYKKSDKNGFVNSENGLQYFLSQNEINSLNISLTIQTENNITNSIKLNKAILNSLELSNASTASVEILRSKINYVFIRDLSCRSLKIYDLTSRGFDKSVFEARNVDFSNATFDKTDLSSYDMVSFYRSTLTDIVFVSPKFPNEIHVLDNIHYPEKREDDYFRMQSENYRQIKQSLLSSGNQIKALEIHSKMYSNLQKDNLLSWEDRSILYLNQISNKHGVSIFRPFFVLCFLSSLLFFFYRASLNESPYELGWESFGSFGRAILDNFNFVFEDLRSLWVLINPTHKLSTLEAFELKTKLNSTSIFISFLSRIVMAWIIYQFVISFRKFGRKL